MEMSKAEALDFLRKWKQGGEHIYYLIEAAPDHEIFKGRGIVDTVTDDAVGVFADHPTALPQDLFVLTIPLAQAEYEYLDSREYLEEAEMRKFRELQQDHTAECALYITIRPMKLRFAMIAMPQP